MERPATRTVATVLSVLLIAWPMFGQVAVVSGATGDRVAIHGTPGESGPISGPVGDRPVGPATTGDRAGSAVDQPNGTVAGYVVAAGEGTNGTGNLTNPPILDATVEVVDLGVTTRVDLYGFYEFDLPAGNHTVRVNAPGYDTVTREVTVTADRTRREDFLLNKTADLYTVRVNVEGKRTGLDLSNATVSVGTRTKRTDGSGSVTFRNVPSGSHRVTVDRQGYDTLDPIEIVVGPRSKSVNVEMAPTLTYRFSGDVTGPEHGSVTHGAVTITGVTADGRTVVPTQRVKLGVSGGSYDVADLPPLPGDAHYEMTVTATGYEPENATLDADPAPEDPSVVRDVELTQVPTTTEVSLRAPVYRDASNEAMPVVDAEVIFNGTGDVTGDVREVKYTDSNGTVTFETLLPGRYRVTVTEYVLFPLKPPTARSVEGEIVVRGVKGDDIACGRPERVPLECQPKLEFPEVTRTVVVERVVEGEPNRVSVNRTPVPGGADLRFVEANGTQGENGTARYGPSDGARVNLTLPEEFVDVDSLDPRVRRNATAIVTNLDRSNYYVTALPSGDRRGRTNQRGRLSFTLYPGTYDAEAVRPVSASESRLGFAYFYGRADRHYPVYVQPRRTTEATRNLYPTWTAFEGEVLDARHSTPVPGAEVRLSGEGWDPTARETVGRFPAIETPEWAHDVLASRYGGITRDYTTDGRGRYADRVPVDNYTLTVTATDYLESTGRVRVADAGPAPVLNTTRLEANRGNVTVQFTAQDVRTDDEGNRYCAGRVETYNTTPTVYSLRSNETMAGSDLPPGDYEVRIPWESPRTVTIPDGGGDVEITVYRDDHTEDDLDCNYDDPYPTFVVSGLVVDETRDEPLAGASVTLYKVYDNGSVDDVDDATTGADGRFTMRADQSYDESKRFYVSARKGTTFVQENVSLGVPAGGLRLTPEIGLGAAQGRIGVTVVDGTGAPIEDARVEIPGTTAGTASTDADGRAELRPRADAPFVLPVDVGTYSLSVSKEGYWAPANDSSAYEETVVVEKSNEPTDESRTVTLERIDPPEVTAATMDRGPSTDEKGLFLEGVYVEATVTAIVEPDDLPFEDAPVEEKVALVANRGEAREWRTVGASTVERLPNGSYRVVVPFNLKDLPQGRNDFTLVVETNHSLRTTHRIRTDDGSPYYVDVLPIGDGFATSINRVASVTPRLGQESLTVDLSGKPNASTNPGFAIGPKMKVTVNDSGRYVTYSFTFDAVVSAKTENPLEYMKQAKPTFGVGGAVVAGVTLKFDGKKRTFTGDKHGSVALSRSAKRKYGLLEDPFTDRISRASWVSGAIHEVTITPEVKIGGGQGVEATYGAPRESRADFESEVETTYTVEGSINVKVKVDISSTWIANGLATLSGGTIPATPVGFALDRMDTNPFVTFKPGWSIKSTFVYPDYGGSAGAIMLEQSEEPPDLVRDRAEFETGPEFSAGLGVEVMDGKALTISGALTMGARLHTSTEIPFPHMKKLTGKWGGKAKVAVPWPGPTLSPKWTFGKGTLVSREFFRKYVTGRLRARGAVATGPVPTSTATVTELHSPRFESATANRYWADGDYSRFDWEAGDTEGTVVANAFPRASPTVAATGGRDALLVYARNDVTASRPVTNLRFSTFEGDRNAWSPPEGLPGGTEATAPVASELGDGRTVVVWRSTGAVTDLPNPLLGMDETELAYAVHDGESWQRRGNLTDNAAYEGTPVVAGDGGTGLAVWRRVPTGHPIDMTDNDLAFATVGGEETRGTVVEDVTLAGRPTLDFEDGRGVLVYPEDADGDLSTTGDRRIMVVWYTDGTWRGPRVLVDPGSHGEPAVELTPDGARVAWWNGTAIAFGTVPVGSASASGVSHLEDPAGVRQIELFDGPTGEVMVWRGFGEASSSTLHYVVTNESVGGFDAARTRSLANDALHYGAFDATLTATGERLVVVAPATPNATAPETPPDIRSFVRPVLPAGGTPDIDVSRASLNRTTAAPGDAIGVVATVTNDGSGTGTFVAEVTVDGRTLDSRRTTVPPGESREVSFTLAIDEEGPHEVAVGGTAAGTVRVERPADGTTTTTPDTTTTTATTVDTTDSTRGGGPFPWWPVPVILLVLLILIGGVYYYRRERGGADGDGNEPTGSDDGTGGEDGS